MKNYYFHQNLKKTIFTKMPAVYLLSY